jgi:hypothetical protein
MPGGLFHMVRVSIRFLSILILLLAFAGQPFLAWPQTRTKITLSGEIEDNNGKFRLYLSNESEREFRGRIIIGIGNDVEQREIGQLTVALPPLETRLLQFGSANRAGSHYSLRALDAGGTPVFTRIAPIKSVSDPTPATEVSLAPVSRSGEADAGPAPRDEAPAVTDAEVAIKAKLLGGENETDPLKISLELTPLRPIADAQLSIAMGKHQDRKPFSASRPTTIEFQLPEEADADRITYVLADRNGRMIARGEIKLDQLMADDYVNVLDIRTDRAEYEFGATAKVTIVLEGQSPHGYRLEVSLRDTSGAIFFSDQRQSKPGKHEATQEFTITLPRKADLPLTFEFKIHDGETGLLFDSGERELPIN